MKTELDEKEKIEKGMKIEIRMKSKKIEKRMKTEKIEKRMKNKENREKDEKQ